MSDQGQKVGGTDKERNAWDAFIGVVTSVQFAVTVVVLITIACIAGTLVPQGVAVNQYLLQNPSGKERMAILGVLGITNVYYCWWFIVLLATLAVSLSACIWKKFSALGSLKKLLVSRGLGSFITHLSLLLVIIGGVVRGAWGEKGYLEIMEGQTVDHYVMRGKMEHLPFSIRLKDFEIEMYEQEEDSSGIVIVSEELHLGLKGAKWYADFPVEQGEEHDIMLGGAGSGKAVKVSILKRVADFVIDTKTREVASRSDEPNNPAILVEVKGDHFRTERWLFARYPDFDMHQSEGDEKRSSQLEMRYDVKIKQSDGPMVKDYKSSLEVIRDNEVVFEKTIEVNNPLRFEGYSFYQSGYDPNRPDWTSLQVVSDPSVPIVYAGFLLMCVGLFVAFYTDPQKLKSRNESGEI